MFLQKMKNNFSEISGLFNGFSENTPLDIPTAFGKGHVVGSCFFHSAQRLKYRNSDAET